MSSVDQNKVFIHDNSLLKLLSSLSTNILHTIYCKLTISIVKITKK